MALNDSNRSAGIMMDGSILFFKPAANSLYVSGRKIEKAIVVGFSIFFFSKEKNLLRSGNHCKVAFEKINSA